MIYHPTQLPMLIQLTYLPKRRRTSSNGRTSVCGTENRGSIPRVRLSPHAVEEERKN